MFDNVQHHISIFRCDYCSELLSISGDAFELLGNMVYLVTENPRNYLKHYDSEESLFMEWVACCVDCFNSNEHKDMFEPVNRVVKKFNPYGDAATYDKLRQLMDEWQVTPHLRASVMVAAHFVGDRPVV
jgi:hypothetical protein